jgi:hypothetical protein
MLAAAELAMQDEITAEYLASPGIWNVLDNNASSNPKRVLPLPDCSSLKQASEATKIFTPMFGLVAPNSPTIAPGINNSFKKATGIDPTTCNRAAVQMPATRNWCGFSAILSQLGCFSSLSSDVDVLEKIIQLRLIIALGRLSEQKEIGEPFALTLAKEMTNIGIGGQDFGMLVVDDIVFIAKALGVDIAVISDGASITFLRNNPHRAVEKGTKNLTSAEISFPRAGGNLQIFKADGAYEDPSSGLLEDENPPRDAINPNSVKILTKKQKQKNLTEVLKNRNAIVLFHQLTNHYDALQLIA